MTVFVIQGGAPLTDAQLGDRTQAYINRDWPAWERERSIRNGDDEFNTYMLGVSADTDTNRANNLFNHHLVDYRQASQRLAQYRLADGKPEETVETPTGTFDEEGNEIMGVTVVPAIEPLPAQVGENTYDDEGNITGTVTVDNPEIVRDEAERADAQAVIDETPAEVIEFVSEEAGLSS